MENSQQRQITVQYSDENGTTRIVQYDNFQQYITGTLHEAEYGTAISATIIEG